MMLIDDENQTVSPMLEEFYEEAGFRLVWYGFRSMSTSEASGSA